MPRISTAQINFNAGELSPLLDGRFDQNKYACGCSRLENFIPLGQGPARRRPGTRFVAKVKNSDNRTWLVKVEVSASSAYVLEFGDRYIRFYANHGSILSSGLPYEISTPWTVDDLTDETGLFVLKMVQSIDVTYICHPNYSPRKLSHYSATNWVLSELVPSGGPFAPENSDDTKTVFASAATGTGISLIANATLFAAGNIGELFFIEQKSVVDITQWEPGKSINIGFLRRSDGKTYKALNSAESGGITPTHTEGAVYDGNTGVHWEYQDAGYGWVKITELITPTERPISNAIDNGAGLIRLTCVDHGFSSGYFVVVSEVIGVENANGSWTITKIDNDNFDLQGSVFAGFYSSGGSAQILTGSQVLANVLSTIPAGAVGSSNPTPKWAHGAWSNAAGWPTHVTFFRERLVFGRGQSIWMSVAADYEVFTSHFFGEVTPDMAITLTLGGGELDAIAWMVPASFLLVGTAGAEWVISETSTSEALGPANVQAKQQTANGSRSIPALQAGAAVLYVQRSGRKLQEIQYSMEADGFISTDQTIHAEHISQSGLNQLAFQHDPWSVVWSGRADGKLIGFTYIKEQDVSGWHQHQLGGQGAVESMVCIPTPDGTADDLWLIVNRTINGQQSRCIEFLEKGHQPGDDQKDAFYVDCGLSYDGPPVTTVSGLDHLEGATVDILADGATHPQRVVSGGSITMALAANVVHVGLGFLSILRKMRFEGGSANGTSQGKTKRIDKVAFRFLETLGGKAGPDLDSLDIIAFRTTTDKMDEPPPLFSGDKLMEWPGGYDTDGYITVVQDQPLPMTIIAIFPQVTTYDR